ncbi:PREDICTED: olfactory receptor 5V1-like [Nanorana parkeri]|uniref:olfactory receptor 5V1-like n=1 Tax=Nanorana parkeri TaxID=125878 RepID=UPI00085472FF|nr:PREDICTED: olfactory receptor 5V1-like [Nanorana parkeri]
MFVRRENLNNVTTFSLQGFTDLSVSIQIILIIFFLVAYILSLVGNGLIILTISLDSHLHTPMYFFLRGLSLLEICSINVTVPKALGIFLSMDRSISFIGCATQMYIFSAVAVSECLFLAIMAFDRFIAICHPLRYTSVMTSKTCYQLAIGPWVVGFLTALVHTTIIFRLPFCGSHHVAHFFCDIPPLLHLACVNTFKIELYVFIVCMCGATIPFLLILCSYMNILSSVFLLHSKEARQKAMSTCSGHLVSVFIFYGTAMYVHLCLGTPFSSYKDRMTALFYCIIIPTINPLIYSLKNKDMKASLLKKKVNILTTLST